METAKILIVDDEVQICKLLVRILKKTPHKTDEAENGVAALELNAKEKYNLMVVDLNMPKMNGQTLIRKIREEDDRVALIILTGHGDLDTAYKLLENFQISDFLTKPLNNPHQLLFSVRNALEKQRLQQLVYCPLNNYTLPVNCYCLKNNQLKESVS